jgi:hypothetical protein
MANGHPYMLIERAGAFAGVSHHLYCALASLKAAHYLNHAHGLGVDLPSERLLIDTIGECARLHKATETAT